MMAMRTLERVRNQRENSLVPRSHGAGADQDGLVDGEDADECPYRGDQYSVIYAIADVGGDCADPEARAVEIVSNPRLRGDASQYADVDDRFGCDQPIEAAVEELEKSSAPRLLTLLRFDWE